jgi:hypothetical protein
LNAAGLPGKPYTWDGTRKASTTISFCFPFCCTLAFPAT